MFKLFDVAARILFIAVCCFAGARSLIWARAQALFNQKTYPAVELAAKMAPLNPLFAQTLAEASSEDRIPLIRRALDLNPFNSKMWIDLGFEEELHLRNIQAAEQDYLKAAALDHMYVPRWTLANFYFRQDRPREYRKWANLALRVNPYDPAPIFDQLWALSDDPRENAAAVPDDYRNLYYYLAYLINNNKISAIEPAALRAARARITKPEQPPFATARRDTLGLSVEILLLHNDQPGALRLWSAMRNASMTTLPMPSPAHPLLNGNFQQPILNHGFDWKTLPVNGISSDRMYDANEVRFAFSGNEPENCALLQQFVAVQPGARYRLTADATTEEGNSYPGIEWRVYPVLLAGVNSEPLDQAPDGTFTVPTDVDTLLVSLEYHRPLGRTRLEGTLLLRKVALDPL